MANYIDITIADRPLWEFKAKMQSYPEFFNEVDTEVFQGADRSSITLLRNRRGAKNMRCLIDFWGTNKERTLNQSAFEALFLGAKPVRIDIGDGFFYRAVMSRASETVTEGEICTTVEYSFRVTRHTETQEVDAAPTIMCCSNVKRTDCIITVRKQFATTYKSIYIRMNGLEWWYEPPSGQNRGDFVLDGVNKIFTDEGKNVTDAVTWQDFPYLVPGVNTLEMSIEGWTVDPVAEIQFTPTYL